MDKGAAGLGFEEFVEARFIQHPFFSDAKYLWRTDYDRAMQKLKQADGNENIISLQANVQSKQTS